MTEKINLNAFPKNFAEALAILYLQNQDLSGLTPEELLEKYKDAYDRICAHSRDLRNIN